MTLFLHRHFATPLFPGVLQAVECCQGDAGGGKCCQIEMAKSCEYSKQTLEIQVFLVMPRVEVSKKKTVHDTYS